MTHAIVVTGTYTERVMPKAIGPVVTVVKRGSLEVCETHLARLELHNSSSYLRREIMPLTKVPHGAIGR
jgi:hypothetical protein